MVKQAVKEFEQSCEKIADKINEIYFDGMQDTGWVGDEIGGVCYMGDWFLSLDFMVTALRYEATEDQFFDYYDLMLDEKNEVSFKNYIKK